MILFLGVRFMCDSVRQLMEAITKEKGIPFLDVVCYREHKEVLRDTVGSANGNEFLYMYSCSKPITVTAVMMLFERGLLSLDDLVEKYIPEYKNLTVIKNGAVFPCDEKMTVKHLLTMTGGLDYNLRRGNVKEIIKNNPCATTEDVIKGLVTEPLVFEPGHEFRYSLCHDVLAVIVEKASGVRFSEFVRENIFKPLGMDNSTFDNKPKNAPADIYKCENGTIVKSVGFRPITPCYESGGGGLIGTVNDYIKFADMLACGGVSACGDRLLDEKTVAMMRSEQIASISVNNTFTCVQGDDYGYGLGMRTRIKETDWGLPVGEFGWDGAAGSYLLVDPVRKISVVMGMHVLNWPDCFVGEHLNIVKEIYKCL